MNLVYIQKPVNQMIYRLLYSVKSKKSGHQDSNPLYIISDYQMFTITNKELRTESRTERLYQFGLIYPH